MVATTERLLYMRKGTNFDQPSHLRIVPTDYEMNVHKLPGFRLWLSPETRFECKGSLKGLRERRTKTDIAPFDAAAAYGLGFSIGDQPTLDLVSGAGVQRGLVATGSALAALGLGFMTNGYTRIFVVKKAADGLQMPLGALNGTGGYLYLRGSVGYGGRVELNHAGTAVYTTGAGFSDGAAHVILQSWDPSTRRVVIEVDGVPQPLTSDTLAVVPLPGNATQFAIGGWNEEANCFANGSIGEVLMSELVLTRPEWSGVRDVLYRQLKAKYKGAVPLAIAA